MKRVLVISHTSFTSSNSMGSTLASYLTKYDPDCVAQFYIKKMTPDIPVCRNYFCVTDREILHKVTHPFSPKIGRVMTLATEGEKDKSAVADKLGSQKHRDLTMLARNMLWATGLWNNRKFKDWLQKFDPEMIMVQPGDFSYLLKMAVKLSKKLRIPLIVHQSEAYYLKEYEKKTLVYRLYRWDYARQYEKMMNRTKACIYLCDALKQDYDRFFNIPSYTIMKSTQLKPQKTNRKFGENGIRFVYGGNLGETVGRCVPLVEMGKAIKKLGWHIDVYTASTGEHMKDLTEENGIHLHEAVPYEKLQEIIRESDFVLHMESQSEWHCQDLKYAFTTKIADMLASGVCSIVYGSTEIASIRYFKEHKAGCVIEQQEDLKKSISHLISSETDRDEYIRNALYTAEKYHNAEVNAQALNDIISSCAKM